MTSGLDEKRWWVLGEVLHTLRRNTEIFNANPLAHPLATPAFLTELGISLFEILKFLEQNSVRLYAEHDVSGPNVATVADLLRRFRVCVAHSSTTEARNFEENVARLSMNIFNGRVPRGIVAGDTVLGSQYEDDIAINFGPFLIYFWRHLVFSHNVFVRRVVELMSPDDRERHRFDLAMIQTFEHPAIGALVQAELAHEKNEGPAE